ncbi:unnamed protein product [Urochloa decumbens]|uniref:Uncharacterized protein n=1 Tax=Urochloa decumbens TaxID=240449 RepID=A0ABC9GKR8_9POAL
MQVMDSDEVAAVLGTSSPSAVVRMNSSGEGKASYANNSDFQRAIASVTRKARRDMAAALYRARGRPASLAIADLGCATGPNALLMVSDAVEAVLAESRSNKAGGVAAAPPQLHVFLNDLPANDFNAVFRLLPSSPLAAAGCLVSAWPGSFYGRLFPDDSLDYVVSSSSLHFLSKAPSMATENLNRGRVYVSAGSPAGVLDAYRAQFDSDFLAFLGCRAAETRPRGVLLLTFVARRSPRPAAHDCYLWDLLADALMGMAAAGLVDEGQVHAFNAPYYAPCPDDLARAVAKEGSFSVRTLRLFDTSRRRLLRPATASRHGGRDEEEEEEVARWLAGETAGTVRAVVEPMLRTHFGWAAMDGLFCRYRLLLEAYYRSKATRNKDDITNVFLVLEKKQHYVY